MPSTRKQQRAVESELHALDTAAAHQSNPAGDGNAEGVPCQVVLSGCTLEMLPRREFCFTHMLPVNTTRNGDDE